MELQEQRAGQQRRHDGEGRVFGRGRNEQDGAIFYGRKQCVLLGFGKAVDFVDEEDGADSVDEVAPGLVDNGADFFDAGTERRQSHEAMPCGGA